MNTRHRPGVRPGGLTSILILAAIATVLAAAGGSRTARARPLFQTGRPPDLIVPHRGQVRLRVERGSAMAEHRVAIYVDDGGDGTWDRVVDLGVLPGASPVLHTVWVEPGDLLDVHLEARTPSHTFHVWYGSDRDTVWPGDPQVRIYDHFSQGASLYCGSLPDPGSWEDVTHLWDTRYEMISLSCWEDHQQFDHNDFLLAVDYVPGSIPPPASPALDAGPACVAGGDRTVVWTAEAGAEVQVQAARHPSFGAPLDSGWIAGGGHTFQNLGEGIWYYRARARNPGGTGDWGFPAAATQDQSPPTTGATPSGTLGQAGWYHSDVQVALAATDAGCGLDRIEVQVDGGGWMVYGAPVTVTGDGSHQVTYRSVDVVGHREPDRSLAVAIDTLPPTTLATPAGTVGQDGWYRSTVDLSLVAVDATSGVAITQVRLDEGAWSPYTGPVAVVGDGLHTVGYRSTDVAGHGELTRTLDLWLDGTPPETTAVISGTAGDGGWYRSARVDVSLDGLDATSGVRWTGYQIGGGGWVSYTAPFSIAGDGMYTLTVRSRDVAGNQEPERRLPVPIDSTPPQTTAGVGGTLGANGWYTGGVTLSLAAVDGTSGVREALLEGQVVTGPVRFTGDGRYSLAYRSVDVAGNREMEGQVAFDLDTTPPQAGVAGAPFCPGRGERLQLSPVATDATSGVGGWQLQVMRGGSPVREWAGTGSPGQIVWDGADRAGRQLDAGPYDLRLRVWDRAGWGGTATGRGEIVAPPPAPPPAATPVPPAPVSQPTPWPTLAPGPTPAATSWPTPAATTTPWPTAAPGQTPPPPASPVPPMPPSTPAPVAEVILPEPEPRPATLRVLVFQDADADARRGVAERGLIGLRVRVEGPGGWVEDLVADERGVVTITLPAGGTYGVRLLDRPGSGWQETTRSTLRVVWTGAGRPEVRPVGRGKGLPVGVARGFLFAFGLLEEPVALWFPAAAAGLLVLGALFGLCDRRAAAIRRLERTMRTGSTQ